MMFQSSSGIQAKDIFTTIISIKMSFKPALYDEGRQAKILSFAHHKSTKDTESTNDTIPSKEGLVAVPIFFRYDQATGAIGDEPQEPPRSLQLCVSSKEIGRQVSYMDDTPAAVSASDTVGSRQPEAEPFLLANLHLATEQAAKMIEQSKRLKSLDNELAVLQLSSQVTKAPKDHHNATRERQIPAEIADLATNTWSHGKFLMDLKGLTEEIASDYTDHHDALMMSMGEQFPQDHLGLLTDEERMWKEMTEIGMRQQRHRALWTAHRVAETISSALLDGANVPGLNAWAKYLNQIPGRSTLHAAKMGSLMARKKSLQQSLDKANFSLDTTWEDLAGKVKKRAHESNRGLADRFLPVNTEGSSPHIPINDDLDHDEERDQSQRLAETAHLTNLKPSSKIGRGMADMLSCKLVHSAVHPGSISVTSEFLKCLTDVDKEEDPLQEDPFPFLEPWADQIEVAPLESVTFKVDVTGSTTPADARVAALATSAEALNTRVGRLKQEMGKSMMARDANRTNEIEIILKLQGGSDFMGRSFHRLCSSTLDACDKQFSVIKKQLDEQTQTLHGSLTEMEAKWLQSLRYSFDQATSETLAKACRAVAWSTNEELHIHKDSGLKMKMQERAPKLEKLAIKAQINKEKCAAEVRSKGEDLPTEWEGSMTSLRGRLQERSLSSSLKSIQPDDHVGQPGSKGKQAKTKKKKKPPHASFPTVKSESSDFGGELGKSARAGPPGLGLYQATFEKGDSPFPSDEISRRRVPTPAQSLPSIEWDEETLNFRAIVKFQPDTSYTGSETYQPAQTSKDINQYVQRRSYYRQNIGGGPRTIKSICKRFAEQDEPKLAAMRAQKDLESAALTKYNTQLSSKGLSGKEALEWVQRRQKADTAPSSSGKWGIGTSQAPDLKRPPVTELSEQDLSLIQDGCKRQREQDFGVLDKARASLNDKLEQQSHDAERSEGSRGPAS